MDVTGEALRLHVRVDFVQERAVAGEYEMQVRALFDQRLRNTNQIGMALLVAHDRDRSGDHGVLAEPQFRAQRPARR